MSEKKTLFKNRWVQVNEIQHILPDGSVAPYTSLQGGTGNAVAVLPYRTSSEGRVEFLLRAEITPPWALAQENPNDLILSSHTGLVEVGEEPVHAASRELFEEAGYRVPVEQFTALGFVRAAKMLEGRFHLFTVDLTGTEPEEAPGDGTGFEAHSHSLWVPSLQETPDAIAWAMLGKIVKKGLVFLGS